MPATLDEVKTAAATLSDEDRAELAAYLLEGLDDDVPPELETPVPEPTGAEWLRQLNALTDEVQAGRVVLTPWEEVRKEVHVALMDRLDG